MSRKKKSRFHNRFYKDGELCDAQIEIALIEAVNDWQDGAIIEMRDTLVEIINAIDRFTEEYEG